MAQIGKASAKRSKPSYFMSILGVSLVLFILGLLGWIVINSRKLEEFFREKVEVRVILNNNISDSSRLALMNYINAQPYTKQSAYKDKDEAIREWVGDGNEDFREFLDENILPPAIDLTLRSNYVVLDSMNAIAQDLQARGDTLVTEVNYPKNTVNNLNTYVTQASWVLLAIAAVLAIIVIILIDNTIRLAMFSNRFLIKTMQMVGATRWFIARPMDLRALFNGALSGALAIAGMLGFIFFAEKQIPDLKALHDTGMLLELCAGLLLMGTLISFLSTHRSVLKYLRMKLDDLY